jgi:predicted transcriptional regulator of viral defense system
MIPHDTVDNINVLYQYRGMVDTQRQQDRARALLKQRGMMRLAEFIAEGVTAATISRLEKEGGLVQLGRGLYQLPGAPLDANHSLAEAAKLVPRGVICLDSALAFHGLTDRIPSRIWVAIGPKDWRPRIDNPPIAIMRFGPKIFDNGIEVHEIERVPVRIYRPAKTISDLFYDAFRAQRLYGSKTAITHAVRGMKEALRQRKATPAEIARYADQAGIWRKVQPYLEALTVDA